MNASNPLRLLYCPFPSAEAARGVAAVLLTEKRVACCNILSGVESHYMWEGALTQSAEVVMLCKTSIAQSAAAAARLAALHPYDCPAVLVLDASANPLFSQWIEKSVNL